MTRFLRTHRVRGQSATALLGLAAIAALALAPALANAAPTRTSLSGVVNINTASSEELQLLPGVGKVRADAIVASRKEQGAFRSVDDLAKIKGIGPSMIDKMRAHVVVTGKTTARSGPSAAAPTSSSGGR